MTVNHRKEWFRVLKKDPTKFDDAVDYYDQLSKQAWEDLTINGNIMQLHQHHPGFLAFYDMIHTDIEILRDLYNDKLDQLRGKVNKEWLNNPSTNIVPTQFQLKSIIEDDDRVVDLKTKFREVDYLYKQFSSIMKGFTQRGYSLNNITQIRIAGMEEVSI